MRLQKLYEDYRDRADFYWIYIREAHPVGSRRPARHVEIVEPRDYDARVEVATRCSAEVALTLPQLVDDMDNRCAEAYAAWPDRLFVVGADRRIAYRGAPGPAGFDVEALARHLETLPPPAPR